LDRGLQWALEHELDEYLESGLMPGEAATPVDAGKLLPWQHQVGQGIAPPGVEEPVFGSLIARITELLTGRPRKPAGRAASGPGKPAETHPEEGSADPGTGRPRSTGGEGADERAQVELEAAAHRHGLDDREIKRWGFRDHLTGIVMIHGIGPQLAGQTLIDWTAPIIRLIRDATEADAERTFRKESILAPLAADLRNIDDPVFRANIDFSGETFPVVQVRIPWRKTDLAAAEAAYQQGVELYRTKRIPEPPRKPDGPRWIFTETWWASEVRPPTLRTMVAWLGEQGGVGRIVQGIQQNTFGSGKLHQLARISVLPFVSVIVAFALILMIVGLAVTRFIPIESIRAAATLRLASAFLTDWFGGARTLLRDPAQSANVRNRLVMTVKALRAYGCRRVIVIAHSGGTIVSLTTLTDPAFPKLEIDKLITIGEALNLGWRLEAEDPDAPHPVPPVGNRMRGDLARRPRLLWRDFFGSHDPAASGPPDPPEPAMRSTRRFTTERIYNRMSVLGDHGAYWDNDEQFLIPLIREIDVANGNRRESRFYRNAVEAFVRARRKERLSFLRLWRRATNTLPVMAIVAAGLVTARGMIPMIGDGAMAAMASIPFSKELGDIGQMMSGWGGKEMGTIPGVGPFRPVDAIYGIGLGVFFAALTFAVLQAMIPSGARGMWRQRRWWQRTALTIDVLVGPGVLAIILVGWWATLGPNAGLSSIATMLASANVHYTILFAALFLDLAEIGRRLRRRLRTDATAAQAARANVADPDSGAARVRRRRAALSPRKAFADVVVRTAAIGFSALFLAGLLILIGIATFGVVLVFAGSAPRDESAATRSFVVGSLVVLLLFNLLQKVGTWRWDSWDARERQQLRRDPARYPSRGWSSLIAFTLLGIALGAAWLIAIGTGAVFPGAARTGVFWVVIALVVILCAITIAKDVVDNDVETDRLVGSAGHGAVMPTPTGPPPA
jgi:hypothetical protein